MIESSSHEVTRIAMSDGAALAVEAAGPPGAPPVVLLHGIAQSRVGWRAVLTALAADHRVVAIDMRGHGDSDAPVGDASYASGRRLGDDLHEVIAALGLQRPVAVAWSYGGVVLGEYLRAHGAAALGGIVLAAAAVRVGRPAKGQLGPGMMDHVRALLSDEAATYDAVCDVFVRACTARALPAADTAALVAEMRRVPAHVRKALLMRHEDFVPELAACGLPLRLVHGTADQVVLPALSEAVVAACPDAILERVEGVGHAPWAESPEGAAALARAVRAVTPAPA